MTLGGVFLLLLFLFSVLIAAVRLYQYRSDAKRRRKDRQEWRELRNERHRADTRAHVLQEVKRFFPYLQESVEHHLARSETPREALKAALEALAGVEVGTTENGLRIAMPSALRSRHTVLWGRSGSGKSTLMLHLIKADMDEDRAVVVLCPEAEFFIALLGLAGERAEDVIYLAPTDPLCPITFGPLQLDGDEETSHATELFSTAIKRALGEDSIGPRADPLLANAIGLVVGRPDATLERVRQVLTDDNFRERAIVQVRDPYVARFWRDVFPTFPAGATGPLLSRLDGFLRVEAIRRVLGHGKGSFTIRQVIEGRKRLFIDLSGLTPEMMLLFGGLITAKLELELLRRERGLVAAPAPVSVYVDEFPAVCGLGEGSWATLLSRSRKYNVSLCLAGQFPDQVPLNLRRQIAGNVATLTSFALSARDAGIVSRELLVPSSDGSLKPIPAGELVALPIGTGYLRIGNAACGLKVMFKPPLSRPSNETVERVPRCAKMG